MATSLLPLLTPTDLPPPRSQRNPLETKVRNVTSPLPNTHRMRKGCLHWPIVPVGIGLLTLSSYPSPCPYSPFSPTSSIHHASPVFTFNRVTWTPYYLQPLSLWILIVLILISFSFLPEFYFQTPSPQSLHPALSSKFLSLYYIFYNWLLIGQLLVFDNECINSMGSKNFCSLLYSQCLEYNLAYSRNLEKSC